MSARPPVTCRSCGFVYPGGQVPVQDCPARPGEPCRTQSVHLALDDGPGRTRCGAVSPYRSTRPADVTCRWCSGQQRTPWGRP